MCGRFTLRTPTETIVDMFEGLEIPEIQPSYNIAPTQTISAIRDTDGGIAFASLHWGLIPFWADEKKIGNRMINARCETVRDKPAFRSAFKRRRCLILADGFYEWQKTAEGKQPMYIQQKHNQPFCFAGLWELNKKIGDPIESCTIITTAANELMSTIHDRMPVILPKSKHDIWLDRAFEDYDVLQEMLQPYPDDDLIALPVSTKVNKPSYNAPDCIEPLLAG